MAGVWREIQRTYFYILSDYTGMNLFFHVDYDLGNVDKHIFSFC